MRVNDVEIEDTFSEAFDMYASRLIITAINERWVLNAALSITGFATSVIMCKCEAGIEKILKIDETPDCRPGVSVLFFTRSEGEMEKRLLKRIGQCVLTSPTSACFNGLDGEKKVNVGGKLRFFGDGFQVSKRLGERRVWRIPVMDGEFVIEEKFGIRKAIGGGNFIVIGKDAESVLRACENAVCKIKKLPNVIVPFPGGVTRSGSKVGSKYRFIDASTNTLYCPTIKSQTKSKLLEDEDCALEIVIDGLEERDVMKALRVGIKAACMPGIKRIGAGNFGGKLGKYQFHLHRIMEGTP